MREHSAVENQTSAAVRLGPDKRKIASYARYIRSDTVSAHFQPVEKLGTGEVAGFEALARLSVEGSLVLPATFLSTLAPDDLLALFLEMVGKAVGFLAALAPRWPHLFVSVNVEPSLVVAETFLDVLQQTLDRYDYKGGLVIELLENDAIADPAGMHQLLHKIRALGISIALDDAGSAYSSLVSLRELPIDVVKLDRSFALGLNERPEDLHFILSFLSLARGLGKRLIVEGVETFEIYDALRVLGVDHAQGYWIARPMPREAAEAWIAERQPNPRSRIPLSMLGAYAGHLLVVETCRVMMNQPLPIAWKEESKDPHSCSIGKYFDCNGLHETDYGEAHKRFHDVMAHYETNMPLWQQGADRFRVALQQEIARLNAARGVAPACSPPDQPPIRAIKASEISKLA